MKRDKKIANLYKKGATTCISLHVPYSESNLNFVRSIQDRVYSKKTNIWKIPLTLENCISIKENGYRMTFALKEWGRTEWQRRNLSASYSTLIIPDLGGELFPYQKEGVCFIESKKGRALIADEMGLGKTVQALAYLQLHKEYRPALIVCTASMKGVWEDECKKWVVGCSVQSLYGTKPYKTNAEILIINYDLVDYWKEYFNKMSIKILVMDEVHYIKSDGAKRTKAIKNIASNISNVIGLSGTPMEQGAVELYNAIHIINPAIFPNKRRYLTRYCNPKHNGFGWTYKGVSNVDELHKILIERIMIRRKKADVLKELPDKTYATIRFDITNRTEYERVLHDFKNYMKETTEEKIIKELKSSIYADTIMIDPIAMLTRKNEAESKATALAQLSKLKILAAQGKLDSVIEWIEDFLVSGEKLVVFCEHIFAMDALRDAFAKCCVVINGSVPPSERAAIKDRFQKDKKIKLFIGNKAAQEGLTLTAASNVAIIEFPWNPGALSQRIDRVHRITQKNAVNVWYLLGKETIDEDICKLIHEKMKNCQATLDGGVDADANLMNELVQILQRK